MASFYVKQASTRHSNKEGLSRRWYPEEKALLKSSAPTHQLTPQALAVVQEPIQVVHARQTTAQEPPPFFEAAAVLQSASEIKRPPSKPAAKPAAKPEPKPEAGDASLMTDLDSAMDAFSGKPAVPQSHAEKPAGGADNVAAKTKHAPKVKPLKKAPQHAKAKKHSRTPLLRGADQISKVNAAPAIAKPVPAVPAVSAVPVSLPKVSSEANAAASAKDSDAGPSATSDFDALEAQLHEEDRRIQDLDRENADSMTDGGLPAASGSSPPAATKPSAAAQPKLEADSEAPMEDFLNVEAPGPEVNEATSASASSPADAAPANTALALPQDGADAALSDNQFLAQIAPAPKHA